MTLKTVLTDVSFWLILIAVLYLIRIYNRIIGLRNQVDRAWANIDILLKQRFDEIPQLVAITERYMGYESALLKKLVVLRTHYTQADGRRDQIEAAQTLGRALTTVLAVGEDYPELAANKNFMDLQARASHLEEAIADRREVYNESVAIFNTRLQHFPAKLFVRLLGFKAMQMVAVPRAETVRPDVRPTLPEI